MKTDKCRNQLLKEVMESFLLDLLKVKRDSYFLVCFHKADLPKSKEE